MLWIIVSAWMNWRWVDFNITLVQLDVFIPYVDSFSMNTRMEAWEGRIMLNCRNDKSCPFLFHSYFHLVIFFFHFLKLYLLYPLKCSWWQNTLVKIRHQYSLYLSIEETNHLWGSNECKTFRHSWSWIQEVRKKTIIGIALRSILF
jgi:hypothetical protein